MPESEIQINIKGAFLPDMPLLADRCVGPNELKLQISIATDKTVGELKQAVAAQSDVEAERQRLIYSGASLRACTLLYLYLLSTGRVLKASSFFNLQVTSLTNPI
jgi:ubiquilin